MQNPLWQKIATFDFDEPPSEYGFSTRLANENFWTKSFTAQAILEYKKFMYLAATADQMVSPSEIVDTIWHQHLIFTQSYQKFCLLLGKLIQHIPSTHNKEDFQRFKLAKERTTLLYEKEFGLQPKNIWEYRGMFESLNLEKAKLKLRSFTIIGILAIIGLAIPAYFFLRAIYIRIDNPYFIIGIVCITIATLLLLNIYNKAEFKTIISGFDGSSFVYDLQAYEVIYLQSQDMADIINGELNELVDKGIIHVDSNNSMTLAQNNAATSTEQLQVTSILSETGPISYSNLLKRLMTKPIFWNTANSMNAFKKYFIKSKKFGVLFYTNFAILGLLFLLSFTRMVTGMLRDKPIALIAITTLLSIGIAILFLQRLTNQFFLTIIPDLYKSDILARKENKENRQWKYLLVGTAAFSASFAPLPKTAEKNTSSDGGNCGTSCGSSCGSSCSSSCGGCGGD